MIGGNTPILVLKIMLGSFLKMPPTQENMRISRLNHKLNQLLKIYKMIFINKKTNNQKVLNFVLTLVGSWRAKSPFKALERQNLQNQAVSELYADDDKSKYSSKSEKSEPFKAFTTEFVKIRNRTKISNEQFNLCEAKIYLDEIIRFINSQIKNKSPGNDDLTTGF